MPRVPLSSGPELRATPQQGGYRENIDVSAPARQLGQALGRVGENLSREALREAETRSNTADTETAGHWLAKDAELRRQYQGANVDQYQVEAAKWWKDKADSLSTDLDPLTKSMVSKTLGRRQAAALGQVAQHVEVQKERHADEVAQANIDTTIQFGVTSGDVVGAANRVRQLAAEVGARKGWNTDQVLAEQGKNLSALHLAQISKLAESDPTAAQAYYQANKDEVAFAQQPRVEQVLNQAGAANDGEQAADQTWKALGPKGYNDPVALDKMEAKLRETYAGDAPRRQAAIASLRERAAAHNAAQAESNAGNVNSVYQAIDGGLPMARVMRTPQWLALPGKEQDQILTQQEGRAAARESRTAAAEQRAYSAEQRKQHQMLLDNAGDYLTFTDPEVLAKMTRSQVAASRSIFGFEGAQHLLTRYDALQKNPGDLTEARMDEDAFKRIGKDFGVETYNPQPHDKELVGTLKYRVERVLGMAQVAKGKRLTEEEKEKVMREEMSRQVTLSSIIGTSQIREHWWNYPLNASRVPVILLQPDQVREVVVPPADKVKISEALATMYAQDPRNPAYAPTEDNMRRLYLMRQSRAASLIAPAK